MDRSPEAPASRIGRALRRGLALLALAFLLPAPSGASEAPSPLLSLEDCVRIALQGHPGARKARALVEEARGDLDLARTRDRLTLNLGVTYHRETTVARSTPGDAYDAGILLNQPLYDWGRTRTQTDLALGKLDLSRLQEIRSLEEIVFDVEKAYYGLVLALREARRTRDHLVLREEHLARTRRLLRLRARPAGDAAAAEVEASKARVALIEADASVEDARGVLYYAMGRPSSLTLEYAVADPPEAPIEEISFREAVDRALAQRPDFRAADLRVRQGELERLLIRRENAPSLQARGETRTGGEHPSEGDRWRVGVELTVPLVDGGVTEAKFRRNRGNLEAREAERDQLRNLIVLQTKQAWVSRRESGERLRVSRTGELQGQASLALATEGYERGRRSSLEVSDALKNLNDTRREVNRALHARLASEAALRFVMGDPILPSPSPAP